MVDCKNCYKFSICLTYLFAIWFYGSSHQKVGSFLNLAFESGFGHVTYFGEWDINKYDITSDCKGLAYWNLFPFSVLGTLQYHHVNNPSLLDADSYIISIILGDIEPTAWVYPRQSIQLHLTQSNKKNGSSNLLFHMNSKSIIIDWSH